MSKIYLKQLAICLLLAICASGCQSVNNLTKPTVRPTSLRDVPASRLSFRFEPDVIAPPEVQNAQQPQVEKFAPVVADFDQNRGGESLERTIAAPDKQRVLVVYQNVADERGDFKLDLYDGGGKLIRRITPDNLALRFADSIRWSPDSSSFAFAAVRRANQASQEIVQEAPRPPDLNEQNQANEQNQTPTAAPSPTNNQTNILAFRTEQVYFANRDGGELKLLTQTEGLRYFFFVWSPDGAMLAALACKESEWQALQQRATETNLALKPFGRPRILEKNGRERRLDDSLTNVDLAWSPDSSKVAAAFDKQIRIYDALGNQPTAASMNLQLPLLAAAKTCAPKIAAGQTCAGVAPSEVNLNDADQPTANELAIYLPIVAVNWTDEKTFYLQTGEVLDPINSEPIRSFLRWHRLIFSPQAAALG